MRASWQCWRSPTSLWDRVTTPTYRPTSPTCARPQNRSCQNSGGLMPLAETPRAHWILRFLGQHDHVEIQQRVVESHITPVGQISQSPKRGYAHRWQLGTLFAGPHGLALLAASNGNNLYFEPPLPLLQFPLRLGAMYWHGSLRVGQQRQPAVAAMRLTGPDPLGTPPVRFHRLSHGPAPAETPATKTRCQHTTMWLAPNIGVTCASNRARVTTPSCSEQRALQRGWGGSSKKIRTGRRRHPCPVAHAHKPGL